MPSHLKIYGLLIFSDLCVFFRTNLISISSHSLVFELSFHRKDIHSSGIELVLLCFWNPFGFECLKAFKTHKQQQQHHQNVQYIVAVGFRQ